VSFLGRDQHKVVVPALRTLGNIATGNENQTEALVQAGCIPYLEMLLSHKKPLIRREAAWIISNVSAGVRSQVYQSIIVGASYYDP
jgi:importin subunit alpha-1